jgi:peptidoglycan DL-endopeptidase CwlO
MIKIHKIATYLMIGTLALAGRAAVAQASEEAVAGIDLTLHELYQSTDNADKEIKSFLAETTSEYENLAFAQVTNYVNIRSKASENSEILGKLYNNSAATIIEDKGEWYKIKSGSVNGYIKSEFLVTGEKAAEVAKSTGNRIATVTTTTLKVREKASLDSQVLTLIPMGDEYRILKENKEWIKIAVDQNTSGYVSSDYVDIHTVFEEAVSIEEEQERLEEEAAANNQSSNNSSSGSSSSSNSSSGSSNHTSKPSSNNNSSSGSSGSGSSGSSSSSSSLGGQIASYALKFEGNPYVWGGTSLTNGADCSGFTQSVFAHFGVYIPRTSRTQATGGRRVSLDSLQAGDLIFYSRNGTINHVALYIGNGKVISASSPSTGIRITSYNYRTPVRAVSYLR